MSGLDPDRSERGIALVMAMLALLVLSLLGAVLLTSVNVGTRIAGHNLRQNQALNTAEAGVAEVTARLRTGEINLENNPLKVAQVFNTIAGTVPVLGTDSTGVATEQPVGQWLDYSTATRGPDVLTVEYKTDPARTVIYKYDPNSATPINTANGYPIYVIHATGRQGADKRSIVTEVIQKPINALTNAALQADVPIHFGGNSFVCGYNHRIDTPTWTGNDGERSTTPDAGDCHVNLAVSPPQWELPSNHKAAAWSTDAITGGGSNSIAGSPPELPGQTGFYDGPWEALGMTQAEFFSWLGPARTAEVPDPEDVLYLDNNSATQDQSGDFKYNGGNGEGLLYVDGDLTVNGTFTYRGLIYVEGDLHINGNVWILGGIIVRGVTEVKLANGSMTLLYSKDSIEQNIAKHGGQFVTLSWREL
jgi:Tfp pilus assembly protein PilX